MNMEPSEIQQLWKIHDEKLEKYLKLNTDLLRKLNLDKSKRELNKPYRYEWFNLIAAIIIGVFIAISAPNHIDDPKITICFIASIFMLLIFSLIAVARISKFSKINFNSNTSIITFQKQLIELKKAILTFKKIELYMLPIAMIVLIPVMNILINQVNIFHNITHFIIVVILSTLITIPLIKWIYKVLYERKVDNIVTFLDEIAEYEKQEITE